MTEDVVVCHSIRTEFGVWNTLSMTACVSSAAPVTAVAASKVTTVVVLDSENGYRATVRLIADIFGLSKHCDEKQRE